MFALLAVVLFGVGAVAVDLGNAYQRQRTVQSQADLGAMAAGAKLPTQADVVLEACRNATLNLKVGQDGSPVSCTSSTTALANPTCPTATAGRSAHVFFFSTNPYKVKVCSPGATVGFGLARALPGVASSIDVRASATVVGGTPGALSEMPFYGVSGSGCDYGAQALTDPARGQSTSASGVPANLATPTSGAPSQNTTLTSLAPAQIPTLTAATLQITGNQLSKVTAVGFFRETTYPVSKVEPTLTAASDSTGKTITYTIPVGSDVLAEESLWYLRVYETGSNASQTGWSKDVLVLRVGDPVISCGSLSNSGNFGALKLPRTDSNASTSGGWMANNIADGLQKPLNLVKHEQAVAPWTCVGGSNNAVYSTVTGSPTLIENTNCVTTDTGLTANATTAGLITGTPLFPDGRLARKPTSTGILGSRNCAPGRSGSSRSLLGKMINNDTLSCYLTNPAMTIDTIARASYSGGAVLDPAIFDSPRFCYVPIVNYDPTRGRSFNYSVVDVRPCFITGEIPSSSWNTQQFVGGTGANNGVTMNSSGNSVETLGVVFFNRNALPSYGGNLGNYIGVGPVSVQMVD